ncbi:MAG: hypothetical protein ACD_83C00087G0003 [uncultured bacterium]|uniref:Nucleotidyl transferase AbiEii/AbiGii toxin family protein n=1 Tax=Berkelbacteria bacterium GW2011_GWA2_38_9 TaxID=1618334 RepID=A0A0G0NX96_9BACT|nr:MAG: hypothetical protein ACD_83C00087G0003 [uncultured bacterium]KKQ90489.1 MAG: hypothetical protein UT11_C0005G0030 [Berkelbacteria bacterium GW2011_GWA2_38_9]
MEQEFGKNLMKEFKIDITQLAQEEWEMKILAGFFATNFARQLIFKGGTALRLAYNSPRFSEDLDFTLNGKLEVEEFTKTLKKIANQYPELTLVESQSKFYTYFALFKIKESWLNQAFSIKVEISKRQKEEKNEIRTLISPTTNLQVIARVQTLEQILNDKIAAAKTRDKARDFFDLWYIYQLKREPVNLPKKEINEQKFKSELRKFLPNNYWPVVDEIIKKLNNDNS